MVWMVETNKAVVTLCLLVMPILIGKSSRHTIDSPVSPQPWHSYDVIFPLGSDYGTTFGTKPIDCNLIYFIRDLGVAGILLSHDDGGSAYEQLQ